MPDNDLGAMDGARGAGRRGGYYQAGVRVRARWPGANAADSQTYYPAVVMRPPVGDDLFYHLDYDDYGRGNHSVPPELVKLRHDWRRFWPGGAPRTTDPLAHGDIIHVSRRAAQKSDGGLATVLYVAPAKDGGTCEVQYTMSGRREIGIAPADINLIRSDVSRWTMTDGGGRLVVDPAAADVVTAIKVTAEAIAGRPNVAILAANLRVANPTWNVSSEMVKVAAAAVGSGLTEWPWVVQEELDFVEHALAGTDWEVRRGAGTLAAMLSSTAALPPAALLGMGIDCAPTIPLLQVHINHDLRLFMYGLGKRVPPRVCRQLLGLNCDSAEGKGGDGDGTASLADERSPGHTVVCMLRKLLDVELCVCNGVTVTPALEALIGKRGDIPGKRGKPSGHAIVFPDSQNTVQATAVPGGTLVVRHADCDVIVTQPSKKLCHSCQSVGNGDEPLCDHCMARWWRCERCDKWRTNSLQQQVSRAQKEEGNTIAGQGKASAALSVAEVQGLRLKLRKELNRTRRKLDSALELIQLKSEADAEDFREVRVSQSATTR
eukprot:SAG31_NODE_2975_length_4834_cov_3.139176_3_plen_547_part_00